MLNATRTAAISTLAVLACVVTADGTRHPARAAAGYVTGTIKVTVSLTASSALPNGTSVYFTVSGSPSDPVYYASSSLNATKVVAGGAVNAVIAVPYRWLVSDTSEQVYISIYASAYGNSSSTPIYDTSTLSENFALPANGAITSIAFTGTI